MTATRSTTASRRCGNCATGWHGAGVDLGDWGHPRDQQMVLFRSTAA